MADINIGTTDAPLLVPEGSAGHQAYLAKTTPTPDAGADFKVNAPATFDQNVTKTAFGLNAPTASDIRQTIVDKELAQKSLLEAGTPTALESDLTTQLLDIRGKIDTATLDEATKYITSSNRGILTDVAVGQAGVTRQLDQLKIQGLKMTESNLLQRLGIETTKRQQVIDKAKTLLGFATDKFDTYYKIQDKIDQQTSELFARTDRLSDNARSTLGIILDQFAGLDYKDLDANSQIQITNLANQSGIPIDLLVKGMEVAKNAAMAAALKNSEQSKTTDQKDYEYAVSQGFKGSLLDWQKIQANLKTPKSYTTVNYGAQKDAKVTAALSAVSPAINAIKGPDQFVNPYGYKELYNSFVANNPGFGESFLSQYPIDIYINPRDRALFNK